MKKIQPPKISVVMPVYNEEKFLDESIQSILNQTFKDFEFIIINDASIDNSLKIIKKYKDKRIKIINNKKNKGFAEAVNIGWKATKGKYIANFNQDDISHPKRLEKQFNYLEKNLHIFLVGSSAIYIDENGKEIRRFRKYDNHKMLAWRLRRSNGIIHPSTIFRNEEIYFNKYLEYDFYYRLLKQGKNLTNLPAFLIKFRVHEKSMSTCDKENQNKIKMEVWERFKDLEDPINALEKVFYSIKLFFHYIKTMKEKKIRFFRQINIKNFLKYLTIIFKNTLIYR